MIMFKLNWEQFKSRMFNYAGMIYVDEKPTKFILYMCPNETLVCEVEKTTQEQDFMFIDKYLSKGNVVKVMEIIGGEPEPEEVILDTEDDDMDELANEKPEGKKGVGL